MGKKYFRSVFRLLLARGFEVKQNLIIVCFKFVDLKRKIFLIKMKLSPEILNLSCF